MARRVKMYWRMREYWSGVVDRFLSAIIMTTILVPSYFIMIWIFPGLDFHPQTRASFKALASLYTFALFAAIAVVAVVLLIAGTLLAQAIKALSSRNDT